MPTTKYLWDDDTDTVVMEKDGAGSVTAEYTHAPARYGRLLSQHRDGVTSHFHYDGNGNTRALTDAGENVTDTYIDTAFGDEIATTGTTPNRYRFGGQYGYQYNEKTQDYYVRARVYEPEKARWWSIDPAFIQSEYVYANNSPALLIDLDGRKAGILLSPTVAKNMPWCKWGTKDRTAPRAEQDRRNGLNRGELGRTEILTLDVNCVCDCCEKEFLGDKKTHKRELNCTVRMWLQVRINKWTANKQKSTKAGVPSGIKGVYGHEQIHVKNFIKAANDAVSRLKKDYGKRKCVVPKVCRILSDRYKTNVTKDLNNVWRREAAHRRPAPRRGLLYKPIGNSMPASNCKKPGKVPAFPAEKQCKKPKQEEDEC